MKKLALIVLLSLSSCTTMQETRAPQNKVSLELNVGYQEAYRLITKSLTHDCELVTGSIQPIIYTDAGYATITSASEGVVAWSLDLKQASETNTTMEFYSVYTAMRKNAGRIQAHVNGKLPGCFVDDVK